MITMIDYDDEDDGDVDDDEDDGNVDDDGDDVVDDSDCGGGGDGDEVEDNCRGCCHDKNGLGIVGGWGIMMMMIVRVVAVMMI